MIMKGILSQEQTLSAISRIKDSGKFYADDELNFLIESSLPTNTTFVGTAVSSVEGQLRDAINQFVQSDNHSLVAPIHINGNHFVGLYIQRVEDGFSIFYIDPTGRNSIPDAVNNALSAIFGDIATVTTNIIQHYQDGIVSNVHCGAFMAEILSSLVNDQMRIVGNRLQERVLVGDGENAFVDVEDRDKKSSDEYGKLLRTRHLMLLGKDAEDDLGIVGPLNNLSLQESESRAPKKLIKKEEDQSTSPDSSDSEYGAKTLIRKVVEVLEDTPFYQHRIDNTRLPEVTEAEIKAHPDKYYIANFRGDYLGYFPSNLERREFVKQRVEATQARTPQSYKSQAVANIEAKYPVNTKKYQEEVKGLGTPEKLQDVKGFVTGYKSSTHFSATVQKASPIYGNPAISTSKDTKVIPKYADHSKGNATLHPKYDDKKKPKHRLIGMATVSVHKASEYIDLPKADIEKLRQAGSIGGKSGVERDNQEIIFPDEIKSQNIAGYVPLAYPDLSKKYRNDDKKLFGLDKIDKAPSMTRTAPKSLGDGSKANTIYAANQEFQWRLAEKFVKEKNPNGELLWVDNQGKFRRFREVTLSNVNSSNDVQTQPSSSPTISRNNSSSQSSEDLTTQFAGVNLNEKDGTTR